MANSNILTYILSQSFCLRLSVREAGDNYMSIEVFVKELFLDLRSYFICRQEGIEANVAAWLSSATGIAGLVGRPISGAICSYLKWCPFWSYSGVQVSRTWHHTSAN